jgi:hypothetical protein
MRTDLLSLNTCRLRASFSLSGSSGNPEFQASRSLPARSGTATDTDVLGPAASRIHRVADDTSSLRSEAEAKA